MLGNWQSFYQVTGEGAAALVALLFLVVTLATGDINRMQEGAALFTTPTVTALGSVVLMSALALVPAPYEAWAFVLMLACMLWNLGYYLRTAVGLARSERTVHWSDVWFYGVGPVAVTLELVAASAADLLRRPQGPPALAAGVLALLILAIRNAWDLVMWLAPRQGRL